MQGTFALHLVFPERTNVLKEPKSTMALPYRLIENERDECIGGSREDFADIVQWTIMLLAPDPVARPKTATGSEVKYEITRT